MFVRIQLYNYILIFQQQIYINYVTIFANYITILESGTMNQKTVNLIGNITNRNNHIILNMWNVSISAGKRPLMQHQHLNFEIMMVESGSGIYTTDSMSYSMTKGDVFIFSSNEQHCITAVGENGLCITNLQFDPQFIQTSKANFDNATVITNPHFCFHHNSLFKNKIETNEATELRKLLCLIQNELLARPEEHMLSIKSYLQLLLIKLVRDFGYMDKANTMNIEQLSHIHRVLAYIDKHFTEQITLQELASLAGLTSNYLCFLFKQISGMTLWDYINAKRINNATQLLTNKNLTMNILDIATQCGYNNTANFNKAFKKITGMTPSEYRSNRHSMIS